MDMPPYFLLLQKLAEKSTSDGYPVMARDTLGASFVAFLLGIVEGNPLPPHYHCAVCFYTDFESETVMYTGFDLPDKSCPCCGAPLKKDGLDIPFETFAGSNGEKDEEFPLNFSGEYLPQIQEYAEILSDGNRFPKLKIQGHSTPTLLRELQILTDIDPSQIPFDNSKVLSLFSSPEALGSNWKTDALGIPSFGGSFMGDFLSNIKPKRFSDLICVLGLALGAGTWKNDTEELLKQGISPIICCRDDIWNELRRRGVPADIAFDIMDNIAKGHIAAGLCASWEGWKQILQAHGLPVWYIRSCEKIRYLAPKAHIASYTMAAWRIAYFKLYYPLEFYTAYLNVVADTIPSEQIYQGKTAFQAYCMQCFNHQAESSNAPTNLQIIREFYARGFEFIPSDKDSADTNRYRIVDGKIMPPLIGSALLSE